MHTVARIELAVCAGAENQQHAAGIRQYFVYTS
jgi:hypothetical protein